MSRIKDRIPWWDRLNNALFPYLGPPKLGPYDQPPLVDPAGKACPLCGAPMSQHGIDRAEGRETYVHCPVS
jgi:hypothetical protein